jgi:hypothetical protein
LPKGIRSHRTIWGTGYQAYVQKDGTQIRRYFMSVNESSETKLEKAKLWLQTFRDLGHEPPKEEATQAIKRKREEDSFLPRNIQHFKHMHKRKNGKYTLEEGYTVDLLSKGKRIVKQFLSSKETMEKKLEKAKAWLAKYKETGIAEYERVVSEREPYTL